MLRLVPDYADTKKAYTNKESVFGDADTDADKI